MRLIGNVEKDAQVRAVASGALPSGDAVIVNADGTVSVVAGSDTVVGTAAVFESAYALPRSTFDSNSNKVVIAYRDLGNSSYGTAVVGTVSGTSISFGSPVVFESSDSRDVDITFDSTNNKVVIAYRDTLSSHSGTAIVGTVSGTSISFGSPTVFESYASSSFTRNYAITFDSSNSKVVIGYRDLANSGRGTAIVGTVSGTSISFGSAANFTTSEVRDPRVTFDSNANKVVFAYEDQGTLNGTAIVGTVSGTSISFGTAVEFVGNSTTGERPIDLAFDPSSNKIVIAYTDDGNSNYGTAIVGTVSGTSISFGDSVVFEAASTQYFSIAIDSNANKVIVTYEDEGNSEYGTFVVGTVSGTSISFGTPDTFADTSVALITTVFDSSVNKPVASYADAGNLNYGTSVVFEAGSTNLTSENFLGFADSGYVDGQSAAINSTCTVDRNQSGLTAGQTYYVQTDGSLGTTAADPSVVAGTAISSTEIIVKG